MNRTLPNPSRKRSAALPVTVALLLIAAYQACLRPFLAGHCRHYPTCSQYAAEAFQTHGFFRGLSLTTRRLLRCRPFTRAGYDPVPPASGGDV